MSQSGSVFFNGTTWTVMYRTNDPATGKRVQVKKSQFKSEKKAEQYLRRQLVQVEDGVHVKPTRTTYGDYLRETWLPHLDGLVKGGNMRPATASQYSTLARCHVIPHLGGTRLDALDAPQLNALYAKLLVSGRTDGKGGLSRTTVHAVHVTISRSLKDATKWGKLVRNAATNADPPQPDNAERAIWTDEQLQTFLDGTRTDRLGALWHLLATTGVRRGEAAGLLWEDVHFDREEINVRRARVVVDYKVVESGPKTPKGNRTMALDRETVAVLRRHRTAQLEERMAWGEAYDNTGLVFTKEDGAGLHPGAITQGFARAVKRSGLPTITVHGVRHSYATRLADAGVSLEVISKRLGHASVSITGDLYRHRTDQSDRAAAEAGALRIVGGLS